MNSIKCKNVKHSCFGVGSLAAPWWNASTCCYFWNAFAYKPWNASLFLSLLTFFLSLQQAWAAWQRQPFLTPLCWQLLNNREWVHCVTAELSIFLPKSSSWHCHCQTRAGWGCSWGQVWLSLTQEILGSQAPQPCCRAFLMAHYAFSTPTISSFWSQE